MLFRGPHDSNDVGAVGGRTESEYSGEDDETCSTSGRSYTSAESATAQSFELRMAQLDGGAGLAGGTSNTSGTNNTFQGDGGSNTRSLLSPGYQLFSTAANPYGTLSGDGKRGDEPQNLTLVRGTGEAEGGTGAIQAGTRANDYPDEDERDDDYLTALLSDIERHAARLDTQFFRYPSAESLKQQMASHTASQEGRAKSSPAAAGGGAAAAPASPTAGEGAAKAEKSDAAGAEGSTAAASAAGTGAATAAGAAATTTAAATTNGTTGSSHSTGTKLFLGGLRYEVIQSGRHTVSWIFQVSCGVHINPTSILIHRKTKNGRSNVAPTGCASVFVADDADVATLLEMNQRIYCAEEGVYVSPTPEVMKELIASKDIVDVTGGRVRGPTHPVVIERAYSVSHHHGHHGGNGGASTSSTTTTATTGTATGGRGHGSAATGGAAASATGSGSAPGGSGAHRHPRSPSTVSAESNLSNQLMGGMPPPYAGAMPPQYATSTVPSASGTHHPPSYAASSVSSSSHGAQQRGAARLSASGNVFPPGQSSSSVSQVHDDGRGSNTIGPLKLDPQRVTFHAYLRNSSTQSGEQTPMRTAASGSNTPAAATAHTVLFLAALPCDATEEYVSWLFSLMSITLPAARIHIIGGSVGPVSANASSMATGAASGTSDCCATVSVCEGDVSIALNYHHRVLCTTRGAWVGHSAQDIAALRASDASLRDAAVLHVDRRMSSQTVPAPSGGGGSAAAPGPHMMAGGGGGLAAYPHHMAMAGGGGGGRGVGGGGASLPPPPTSYPQMFGAMPMPGAMQAGQGGMMPMAVPWGFPGAQARPGMGAEAMYANMPPPPGTMMGGGVPGLPPGAMPMAAMMPPGSGYSMPPPPPPFSFTQSVTIGDRTYQLPPGATVQYLPVMPQSQGMGVPGEGMPNKNGGGGGGAAAAKATPSRSSAGSYESGESSTKQHGHSFSHGGRHA